MTVSASGVPARTDPVEAVIFDYGGVISVRLLRDVHRFEAAMGYPPGSVSELMFGATPTGNGAPHHDFHLLEMGRLSLAEYLTGLERRAPEVLGQPLDFVAYREFTASSAIAVHWPVVHRIRRLAADRMRLGLLTNNVREFGDAWRATFPVDELFPCVVDSSAVGMRKPDPAIYEHICTLLDVTPASAVFLDDNAENVDAATAVGIESIQFGDDPLVSLAELDAVLARRGVKPH